MTHTFQINDRVSQHLNEPHHGTVKGIKSVGERVQYYVAWDNANHYPDWYRGNRLRPVSQPVSQPVTL